MKTSLLIIFASTLLIFAGALIASVAYHKWAGKQRQQQREVKTQPDLLPPASLFSSTNPPDAGFHKPLFKPIVMDAGVSAHYSF